jgi:hypothetical protein
VVDAIELEEPAKRPADLDLERLWSELRRGFAPAGGAMLDVVVRVRPSMLATLERLQGSAIAAIGPSEASAEWRTVRLRYPAPEAARGALLGFGDALEVLEPGAVRAEMARAAAGVVALYAGPAEPPQPEPHRPEPHRPEPHRPELHPAESHPATSDQAEPHPAAPAGAGAESRAGARRRAAQRSSSGGTRQ